MRTPHLLSLLLSPLTALAACNGSPCVQFFRGGPSCPTSNLQYLGEYGPDVGGQGGCYRYDYFDAIEVVTGQYPTGGGIFTPHCTVYKDDNCQDFAYHTNPKDFQVDKCYYYYHAKSMRCSTNGEV